MSDRFAGLMMRNTRYEIDAEIRRLGMSFGQWMRIKTLTEQDAQELLRMIKAANLFLNTNGDPEHEEDPHLLPAAAGRPAGAGHREPQPADQAGAADHDRR